MLKSLLDELQKARQLNLIHYLQIHPSEIRFTVQNVSEEVQDRIVDHLLERYEEVINSIRGKEFGVKDCRLIIVIEEEYHNELP